MTGFLSYPSGSSPATLRRRGLRFGAFLAASMAIAAALCGPAYAASTTYAYDALGRLVQVTTSTGVSVTYSYDAAGNRIQVVSAGGSGGTVNIVVVPLLGGLIIPLPH